jgi:uncharacterized iron-regulated protein
MMETLIETSSIQLNLNKNRLKNNMLMERSLTFHHQTVSTFHSKIHRYYWIIGLVLFLLCILGGCQHMTKPLANKTDIPSFNPGDIIESHTGQVIDFETLMAELSQTQVVYVGERHPDKIHHEIQLKILTSLVNSYGPVDVGMEMFDHSYQAVLNRWSKGQLDQNKFIELTHWYANWRYDFEFYQPILSYIKTHQLSLIGLNLPFHIPPKISTGGLDSLSLEDRKHLPDKIDTTNSDHKQYIKNIFLHHQIPGRNNFSYFYETQCAWEDGMAETLSKNLGKRKIVVLAGNGHIIKKFGIPQRAFQRTKALYRTIYLTPVNSKIDFSYGDYIWVTPEVREIRSMNMR